MHREQTANTDTYSTAVDWNDSLFDDVIDPFEHVAISERSNGREAGRRAGYLEGRDIGRSKGWEIGLELGYIQSFAANLIDERKKKVRDVNKCDVQTDAKRGESHSSGDRSNQRLERCLIISQELIDMVDSFPEPDQLLEHTSNITGNMDAMKTSGEGDAAINDSEKIQDASPTDVISSLQRIRSKFKLLLVLLRADTPLDLKRLLNASVRSNKTNDCIGKKDNSNAEEQTSLQMDNDW